MCVGLHMVTSTPYVRCQISSSGKPSSAAPPRVISGSVDHGMRTAFHRSRGVDLLQRREPDADEAGEEDEAEPEDDRRVRRREQRVVTAEGDVPRDVAVEPLAGDEQSVEAEADDRRRPARHLREPLEGVRRAEQELGDRRLDVAAAPEGDEGDDDDAEEDQQRHERRPAGELAPAPVDLGDERVHADPSVVFEFVFVVVVVVSPRPAAMPSQRRSTTYCDDPLLGHRLALQPPVAGGVDHRRRCRGRAARPRRCRRRRPAPARRRRPPPGSRPGAGSCRPTGRPPLAPGWR